MKKVFAKEADNYTLYGALFGLAFPVIATIIKVLQCNSGCSLAMFIKVQAADPLLWIIDSAPLWLGLFSRFVGMRQDKVDFYARHLEHLVEERTRELNEANTRMTDILHNVPIALFTINGDRSINKGCSAYLYNLMHSHRCEAGRYPDIFEVPEEVRVKFTEWLELAFTRKDLAWPLLEGLAPVTEIVWNAGGDAAKTLAASYFPVQVDGQLVRLMVILRDITAERALQASLEEERHRHDEDIAQISEIIRLDFETFEHFIFESRRILSESRTLLEAVGEGAGLSIEVVHDLFRKIHTLKGNARTFKFNQLTGMAHALEDALANLKEHPEKAEAELVCAIRGQIVGLEEKLNSIIELSKSIVGGRDSGRVREEGRDVLIRVKLEKILELVHLAGRLEQQASGSGESLSQLSRAIQHAVSSLRKCPAGRLFDRFPKMVRDLSALLGKKAAMEIRGADIDVDMDVLDALGGSLVHLVRNAVDHGVEMAAQRSASGKNEEGRLVLTVERKGAALGFTLTDDGRGIDRAAVVKKAVEKGLVSPDAAPHLGDDQIYAFICHPGFSTAGTVTDISGRGVGMDVVADTVKKLQGTLTIQSWPGKGCEFQILIPEGIFAGGSDIPPYKD